MLRALLISTLLLFVNLSSAISQEVAKQKVVFGSDYNYPPYEFLDEKGKPTGFNVDLIRAIGKEMDYDVEIHLDAWPRVLASLGSPEGKINVADMFYAEDRAERVDFLPYHDIVSYVIVRDKNAPDIKSIEDIGDSVLVITDQTVPLEYIRKLDSNAQIVTSVTDEHALHLVTYGKYNYALVHEYTAHKFIKEYANKKLKVSERIILSRQLSFVVKKDNLELYKVLRDGLNRVKKNGTYSEIYIKWFEAKDQGYRKIVTYLLWLSVIGAVSIGLILLWGYTLRSQIRRKTKKVQREVNENNRVKKEVEKKNKELEERNYELDKIVYSVSHNVRSPIATATGLVNVLEAEYPDSENIMLYSDSIRTSLSKLDYYVNRILAYVNNKNVDIILSQINFDVILDDVVREVSFLEESKEVNLIKEVDQPVTFYSDVDRIITVLECLLANSIQYQKKGYEDAPYSKIEVKVTKESVKMKLTDNGIGIKPEYLDRVFEVFYRNNSQNKSSGLGLYVVQQTIHKLGGTIKVESVYKEGTTVLIELPNLAPRPTKS